MEKIGYEKQGSLIRIKSKKNEEAAPKPQARPRGMTTLKLQWLAERLRRCEQIKKQIAEGTYNIDSTLVARALLALDPIE